MTHYVAVATPAALAKLRCLLPPERRAELEAAPEGPARYVGRLAVRAGLDRYVILLPDKDAGNA